jgi:hypothetical protein
VPGLGTSGAKFQISTGWHFAEAHRSYFDSRVNHSFIQQWRPYERLSILDVTAKYALNPRTSVLLTVPIVFNRFSTLLPPVPTGNGLRESFRAQGLGDISVVTQTWLLNPKSHPFYNASLSLGVKTPTGNWNVRGTLPNETGTGFARRAVWPPAIMPGDGGVGIIVGLDAFKVIRGPSLLRESTVFASGNYLINLRNTNGTPSAVASLGVPLTPFFQNRLVNSVPDTFSGQVGVALRIPGTWDRKNLRGLRFRVIGETQGLRAHDLFGPNDGFRQPGWTMSVGPSVTYARGKDFFIVDVPIVFARHIDAGDSALPGLPVIKHGVALPGAFNPNRQLGMVAPLGLSVRYVRSL